jgi:hypothetical protein
LTDSIERFTNSPPDDFTWYVRSIEDFKTILSKVYIQVVNDDDDDAYLVQLSRNGRAMEYRTL